MSEASATLIGVLAFFALIGAITYFVNYGPVDAKDCWEMCGSRNAAEFTAESKTAPARCVCSGAR